MNDKSPQEISELEIDLLLLYYTFADQFGNVDIPAAKAWAKHRLGITLSDSPFKFNKEHIDFLMDRGALPDIRPMLKQIFA